MSQARGYGFKLCRFGLKDVSPGFEGTVRYSSTFLKPTPQHTQKNFALFEPSNLKTVDTVTWHCLCG